MRRVLLTVPVFLVGVIVGGWLLGRTTGTAQDEPIRVQLPNGWTRIGLSPAQKQKVYEVRRKYRKQIDEIEAQINELRKQERTEMIKVLTPEQKDRLVEILLGGTIRSSDGSKDSPAKDGASKDSP